MNRKLYWLVLLNPLALALYGYGLSVLVDFCRFGGVARRLPRLVGILLVGILWLIVWTVVYFRRKRRSGAAGKRRRWTTPVLLAECAAILLLTGCGGYRIYQAAQPYNGKLWSYLHERQTTQQVALEEADRDFLANGLDGVLSALTERCGLDLTWELHTANTLKVTVDETGEIQTLDAFLYAFDEAGEYHAWLVTFDADDGDKMTVYLDNTANTEYAEQERLTPLLDMIDALLVDDALLASLGFAVGTDEAETTSFTLHYSGYAEGNCQADAAGSWYELTENAAGTLQPFQMALYGDGDDGYLLTLTSGEEKLLTVIAEAGTLETAAEIEAREAEEEAVEDAQTAGKTLVSDDHGMTFYLDESTSMRLIVTDAAAGSRAYAFENGEIYNEDPFNGSSGVAESIYFLDERVGFILLTNASQDHSRMYGTTDGGESFAQVLLPTEDGEEDLAGNEFGFTAADMDYIYPPYEEDGALYVEVSYESGGRSYLALRFVSEDDGASWRYDGCTGSLLEEN